MCRYRRSRLEVVGVKFSRYLCCHGANIMAKTIGLDMIFCIGAFILQTKDDFRPVWEDLSWQIILPFIYNRRREIGI